MNLKINKILGILAIFTIGLYQSSLWAQGSSWNPFDIKNRSGHWLDSVKNSIKNLEGDTVSLSKDTFIDSQFTEEDEGLSGRVLPVSILEEGDKSPFSFKRSEANAGEWEPMTELPKSSRGDADMLFVVLVLLTISAGALIALHRNFVLQVFKSIVSSTHLGILHRSKNTSISSSMYLFYGLFCFSAGVFLYLILDTLQMNHWEEGFLLLFFCVLFVTITYVAKHFLLRFIAWSFEIEKTVSEYLFTIAVFNSALGIVLLPFLVMLAFGPEEMMIYIVYGTLVLFGIMLLWRQVRVMLVSLHKVLPFAFHFFIYLCAVEIAPVLLLLVLLRIAI
jgi:hypothetical protein